MSIDGWKFYNHAIIPTTAPHEEPNLKPVLSGLAWSNVGGTPLLARWHTDWDCDQETNWWYIICDSPFVFEKLSRSSRKNIRKSLENCEVKQISPVDCSEDLWRVFCEATERYSNYELNTKKEEFIKKIQSFPANYEFWAGFDKESNKMIGYKICTVYDEWVDFTASKYSTKYLKLRVSDALNYTTLVHYLNICGKKYVSNGSRSIAHETNVQNYYQEHFNFRKAYCHLHIKYRFPVNVIIRILYPFKGILRKHDSGKMHKIVALLSMEEIAKS